MPEEEKKGEEAAAQAPAEKKVGKFTRSDYMVHIFIQSGRKFMPLVEGE